MTELLDDFYPTIIYLHYLKRENEIVTIHFGGGALTVHPKISFTVVVLINKCLIRSHCVDNFCLNPNFNFVFSCFSFLDLTKIEIIKTN